jgi:glucosamine--fructose-6-phosphate aminotransferase (isomerizing)
MKHGPIALVDEQTPSVFLVPQGPVFEKVMTNLEEVRARRGPIIAVTSDNDSELIDRVAQKSDELILVPNVPEYLQPLVTVIPLQLLAYHIALLRGCDVDKPRNLAKSVTVE